LTLDCANEAIGVRTGAATSAAITNTLARRINCLLEPFTRLHPAARYPTPMSNTLNIGYF
jgi:hypothetical protein